MPAKIFCLIYALLVISIPAYAGPGNIAPLAQVKASTEFNDDYAAFNVIDKMIRIPDQGEWACKGSTAFWGYIRYPWIRLTWPDEQTISRVVVYDRPTEQEHTAGGILVFSDGSKERVLTIPNDGSPKAITFQPKKVTWVEFKVTDGMGRNLGLSEIEVYPHDGGESDFVSWVDPTIETTRGRWFFCTPGSRPFGMISAAPYTRNKNQWGGGYNYNSMEILGFSQIHAWIMSGINLMPVTGNVDPTRGEQGWKSKFSHDSEIIQPGYHRLFLDRYRCWVEMTCTDRVSLYRMTYTKDGLADILLSLGGWLGSVSQVGANVKKAGDSRIEGSVSMTNRLWGGPELTTVFFVMEFDQPFKKLDGWKGLKRLKDISALSMPIAAGRTKNNPEYLFKTLPEEQVGISAAYDIKAGQQLQVKIAISYTSVENARRNLRQECASWDFDQIRQSAQNQWNQWLGRISVKGGSHQQKVKFYTDLWHTLLGRHKINDISGDYPVYMDPKPSRRSPARLKIKRVPLNSEGCPAFSMYNFDALWLTMWNLNVLWGLGWPEMLDDFSACLVQYADNGGLLPRGPSGGGYTYIMAGCPATSLITCAYQKKLLTKIDPEYAYETMKRNHLPGGMMGVNDFYIENGWSPERPGETIQWAFEDWALAQMASKMGKTTDAKYFLKRSSGWSAHFNPETGLIMSKRKDGTWGNTNPLSGKGWVEANAWQGTFSVSHDIARLAELMGGADTLCEKLNYAFEQSQSTDFVFGYGSGYVSYANQPGCSNAHVFNHAGKPWLSQYWVRQVNEQAYGGTSPDLGYGGHDEDQGQMGGISALMSLGLFSLRGTCSVEPIYEITSPVFDEISIRLDSNYYPGRTFVIKTYDNSKNNCYIRKAKLNGKSLENCWFYHKDFAAGGILELWLGPEPNPHWGRGPLLSNESKIEVSSQ
ncbi:MAG: glycoside hydrolase family 92 protein [Planctomycetes bacterium]|nr:glycoside hydrolase family 92 protein [Planctomycetota bacterium]